MTQPEQSIEAVDELRASLWAVQGYERCLSFEAALDELAALRADVKGLERERDRLLAAVQDFERFGTRHDVTPTGFTKTCGCFDLAGGFGAYIQSMDSGVRKRARRALAPVAEEGK